MEAKELNKRIARFYGLPEKSEGTFELSKDPIFKKLSQYNTTSELKFDSSWEWLMPVLQKIENIEGMCICIQGGYCSLLYKAQIIEGIEKNAKFATSREKPVDKKFRSIYEVIGNFVLWLEDNTQIQSEINYVLDHVEFNEESQQNIIYMKPE